MLMRLSVVAASYAQLAGAVSEAGGIGTLGMIGLSPAGMREQIRKVKAITDKPYGVDLLLPQVGGNARKTNKDYTGGQLDPCLRSCAWSMRPLCKTPPRGW